MVGLSAGGLAYSRRYKGVDTGIFVDWQQVERLDEGRHDSFIHPGLKASETLLARSSSPTRLRIKLQDVISWKVGFSGWS